MRRRYGSKGVGSKAPSIDIKAQHQSRVSNHYSQYQTHVSQFPPDRHTTLSVKKYFTLHHKKRFSFPQKMVKYITEENRGKKTL